MSQIGWEDPRVGRAFHTEFFVQSLPPHVEGPTPLQMESGVIPELL